MILKNTFVLIVILLLCGLYSIGIIKGLRSPDSDSFYGQVNDVGEGIRQSGKYHPRVFLLRLNGLDHTLEFFRRNEDYNSILNEIKKGDSVTVFFDKTGLDIIQIEKKGKIIIDKQEYVGKESFLFWMSIIAFVITLFVGAKHFYKNMLKGKS